MSNVTAVGYVGFEASDLDAWEAFAGDILGISVDRRGGDGALALRLDDRVHRVLVMSGNADDLAFTGYDCGDDAGLETGGDRRQVREVARLGERRRGLAAPAGEPDLPRADDVDEGGEDAPVRGAPLPVQLALG